nr:nucleotide exchange factor GrpE [Nocardioides panaciterrulae]
MSVPEAEGPAETGEDAGAGDEELEDDLTRAKRDLAGLTSDLQRLQAEYLNYKRRVERDRELVRENATYAALVPIVEVLDTIDRAREHGDLDPGFQTVADQLERVVAKQGLARFGEPGDPFDPSLHEALSHVGQDPEVSVTTCKLIAKAGYRIGDRVVRAAQVLVVDPADEQQ